MLAKKIGRLANFAYEHLSDSSEEARLRFSIMLMDVIDSERNLSEAFLKLGEEERQHFHPLYSCFTQSTSITHSPSIGESVIFAKLRIANIGSGYLSPSPSLR